jgi:hypothetical protein
MVMAMSQDQLQRLLLAHLAGEQDLGAALPDLLAQSLGDDPMAEQLVGALRRRQATEQLGAAETAEVADAEVADAEVADVLDRLYREVEELRGRNRVLADALGACPRCWGEERDCPRCRGRGRPGGRLPDGQLFNEYVEPAVERHLHAAGARPSTTDQQADVPPN